MADYVQSPAPSFDLLRMDRQIQARITGRRVAKLAAWAALIAGGLKRGGALGWLATGLGIYGLVADVAEYRSAVPEWQRSAPRTGFMQRLLGKGRVDAVDHASAASFPASDAPSHDIH